MRAARGQACVEFQIKLGFRKVVVQTRFIDQMLTDYVDRQLQFTVEAFMETAGGEALLNPHGGDANLDFGSKVALDPELLIDRNRCRADIYCNLS